VRAHGAYNPTTSTTSAISVDDIALFDRALTESEIQTLHKGRTPFTVLESGLEVPVWVDGERITVPENMGSVLVTGADLYFNPNESTEPIVEELTRWSTDPTTYSMWAKIGPSANKAIGLIQHTF